MHIIFVAVVFAAVASSCNRSSAPSLSPQDQMQLGLARQTLAEVKALVARGMEKDPAKPDEGDLSMKCAALDHAKTALAARTEPEIRALLSDAATICRHDAPLVTLNNLLNEAERGSPQDRSVLCNVGKADLDPFRASGFTDPKAVALDQRWKSICK